MFVERLHVDGEIAGRELGGHVALRRRAGGDAHDGAVHVVDAVVAGVGGDHHLLAVVERRVQEVGTVVAVAAGRPRRVAHQHVDLTGLQRREAGVGGDRDELDLGGVAEHAGGDHAAEVGVEPDVLTGLVDGGEAGEVVAHAAAHHVVGDHGVEQRLAILLHGLDGVRCGAAGGGVRRRRVAGGHALGGCGRLGDGRVVDGRIGGPTVVIVVVRAAGADEGDGRRERHQRPHERSSHWFLPKPGPLSATLARRAFRDRRT